MLNKLKNIIQETDNFLLRKFGTDKSVKVLENIKEARLVFSYLNELDSDSLLKMAVLLFELYASVDLSANILAEYDNRKNTQLQDLFLDTISEKGVNTSFISVKDWSD